MQAWIAKLNDPSRDVYERRYRLFSALGNVLLLLWLIVALIVDGYSQRILFFAACGAYLIVVMAVSLKTGMAQIGAIASACMLVFVMLPYAFFYNGGVDAGAPNWCIIASVMITLTLKGRLRIFLLVADVAITLGCYALTWFHPELVHPFTPASAYADSLALLIITGVLVGAMFQFQKHISHQERELMQAQQHEIVELSNAQSRFFSSMSHEIRTPVNTIVGLNEMILREDVSDEVAEDARQVRSAGKMLLHLVNDILDMSKLESGRMELSIATYSVTELLTEIVNMMWVHAKQKGISFDVDVDPQLPAKLCGDEMRVKQILINVLNNAIKYTPEGSVSFSVQGRHADDGRLFVTFSVSDTGMGIKKESIPYLFAAFKRVDSAQERQIEGTGLGLAIVAQLVELMDGTVSVNSVYTQGSTFVIEIPQEDVGAEPIGDFGALTKRTLQAQQKYAASFEAPEARVLVVDDNAANLMVVTKLLRDTRMKIEAVHSGEEALRKTLYATYHIIFMDHLMPVMDGIECLHRIRTQIGGLCRDSKIVALTANADAESMKLYAKEGFDGYLVKPCSGERLERECRRLLPRELVMTAHTDEHEAEQNTPWTRGRIRKNEISITTDSIADLPMSAIKRYGIGIIPHSVRTRHGVFRDGMEIDASGLIGYLESEDGIAEPMCPSISEYEAFFARELSKANHVLHISISGSIGAAAYSNAREAARAFNNVTVTESSHLSSGEGLLTLAACRMAQEGLGSAQIAERLPEISSRIHSSFIVENPEYLTKANLTSSQLAKLSAALMVRPVLRLKEGKLKMDRIYIGSRASAWRRYISSELRSASPMEGSQIYVTYVDLSQKDLAIIAAAIRKKGNFDDIVYQKASPSIAVNCGPGAFGLMFEEKA